MSPAQHFVKLAEAPDQPSTRKGINPSNHKEIQKLYRRSRRRAARLILGEQSFSCDVPHEQLISTFNPEVAPNIEGLGTPLHTSSANQPGDTSPFTTEEVLLRFRRAENSASGADQLTYQHWNGFDPDAKAITTIFNVCLKAKLILDSWKSSRTILIPKCAEPSSPTDWRPIALSRTLYRLYVSCIAKRITAWIEEFGMLHPAQKGFLPFDGVFENNFVLEQKVQSARKNSTDICVPSVDISNAFASVLHSVLLSALRNVGAGDTLTDIRDIYYENVTTYVTCDGLSQPVTINRGVNQGCPLSGLLFNIVIDSVVRTIPSVQNEHSILAYDDDLMFIDDEPVRFNGIWTFLLSASGTLD